MWTTAILSMTNGSCSWCGSTKNEKLCHFLVGSGPFCQFFGCFFRLATCKLWDDRPQMALSTGMFQLKKVGGWDKLINSILSCAQITQVLLLSEYQLFNFHHDWGGRSGERGWNSTFGKSSFRAGGGQGLVWCHIFFFLGGERSKVGSWKDGTCKKASCFCCGFTVICSPRMPDPKSLFKFRSSRLDGST